MWKKTQDTMLNGYRKPVRIAVLVMLVLLYGFVFGMSARSAAATDVTSSAVSAPAVSAIYGDISELPESEQYAITSKYAELARDAAHFLEYTALAALWFFALLRKKQKKVWRYLLPVLLAMGTALLDESFQLVLGRGRTFQLHDLVLDALGAAFGVGCAAVLTVLFRWALCEHWRVQKTRRILSGVFFGLFWGFLLFSLFFKVPAVWLMEKKGITGYNHQYMYFISLFFFLLYLCNHLRFHFHRGSYDLDIALLAFSVLFFGMTGLRFVEGETDLEAVAGTVAWYMPLFCGIALYFRNGELRVKPAAVALCCVALLNAVCVFAEYRAGKDFFGMALYSRSGNYYGKQYPGFQTTALDSGILGCWLLGWSLWMLIQKKAHPVMRGIYFLLAASAVFTIYYSKTRNVFVLTLCLIAMMILYRPLRGKMAGRILAFAVPICAALCYGGFSLYVFRHDLEEIKVQIPILQKNILSLVSTIDRVELWVNCRDLILDSGLGHILFGFGMCQASETRYSMVYSDSIYIDIIWICGVIGLVLFLYILARFLWQLLSREREKRNAFPLFLMAASCVCAGCFNILTHGQAICLTLAFGILGQLTDKQSAERKAAVRKKD